MIATLSGCDLREIDRLDCKLFRHYFIVMTGKQLLSLCEPLIDDYFQINIFDSKALTP